VRQAEEGRDTYEEANSGRNSWYRSGDRERERETETDRDMLLSLFSTSLCVLNLFNFSELPFQEGEKRGDRRERRKWERPREQHLTGTLFSFLSRTIPFTTTTDDNPDYYDWLMQNMHIDVFTANAGYRGRPALQIFDFYNLWSGEQPRFAGFHNLSCYYQVKRRREEKWRKEEKRQENEKEKERKTRRGPLERDLRASREEKRRRKGKGRE
jgi:hypothetical protein